MITKKHKIHKFQRKVIGKDYVVYACVLPDCTTYYPEDLVVGKLCICNRCGETCQIRRERDGRIRHKPHCKECTKPATNKKTPTKKARLEDINRLLANLASGVEPRKGE